MPPTAGDTVLSGLGRPDSPSTTTAHDPATSGGSDDDRQPAASKAVDADSVAAFSAGALGAPRVDPPATGFHLPTVAAAPSAPSPATQLASVIGPMQSVDGTHQLTLNLQPEGMGTVRAVVTVDAQQVTIQLTAESTTTRTALEQALPVLRQQFSTNGTEATVLLSAGAGSGSGSGNARPDGRVPRDRRPSSAPSQPVDVRPARAVVPGSTSAPHLVDIKL